MSRRVKIPKLQNGSKGDSNMNLGRNNSSFKGSKTGTSVLSEEYMEASLDTDSTIALNDQNCITLTFSIVRGHSSVT